jgi:carboxypeptidase family protein/TonB-dependent receptor-like protein
MKPRVPALVLPILTWSFIALVSDPLVAQRPSPPRAAADYVLKGLVTDTAGQPIPGAEIVLSNPTDGVRTMRSEVDGRFEFHGLRAVPVAVRARRLGYRAQSGPVRLRPDTAPLVIFVLQAVPTDIDGMVVRGTIDDSKGRLIEFYQHKAQNRFGYFFERAEIERRSPAHVSELLRQLRGVHLSPAGTLGNAVRLRGCRPMVWLNGLRIPDAEVDDVAQPDEIDAMEVYVSMAGMPARFVDLVGKCGAVVIWTR